MPNTHTTLTSLFTAIANAIRGKTGGSAAIVADDFPTAISNIPTGGGAIEPLSVTQNGTTVAPTGVDGYNPVTVNVPDMTESMAEFNKSFSSGSTLTSVSIKNGIAIDYSQCFYQNTIVTSVTLDIKTDGLFLQSLCRGASNVQTVTFVNPILTATNFYDIFHTCSNLETVTWDWQAVLTGNVTDMFRGCAKLKDITFGEGVIATSFSFSACPLLSNASIISIANGLNGTVTGMTLTLHATPKAACATIMGTVSSGTFVADAGGSTSLSDFISNTKGWTLA